MPTTGKSMNLKILRDNVHGDVRLRPEEMRILRTAAFQRLHGCRQLGLTHLVYPAAKHTRFEHVLGVMHVADQIAQHLRNNGEFFTEPDHEELWTLLRLAALLHDMGHVPFGHTLEDEMPVIEKHDKPSQNGKTSRMESTIRGVLVEAGLSGFVDRVLQILTAIAESKNDAKLYELVEKGKIKSEYLVLADIIGNTICADLLDYIKRDHLMTGIRATYDDRIFKYFGVDEHSYGDKTYKRVVIRLIKNGRVRNDCLADLLDILKLRYNLSDKVLFHPRKCAADAMIIKAVSQLKSGDASIADTLVRYSDDGFLDEFQDAPLIKELRKGNLYKAVFSATIDGITTYNKKTKETLITDEIHKNSTRRTQIEERIENKVGLPPNSVLVFAPRPQMTLKPVRVLVQWKDGTIRRLNEITEPDDRITARQVDVLEEIYPRLWKLFVFVHPDFWSYAYLIQQEFMDALSDLVGLTATCEPALQTYLERSPEYRWGKALTSELRANVEFLRMSENQKAKVVTECHKKAPNDFVDDRDVDPELQVAARNEAAVNSRQIQKIINNAIALVSGESEQMSLGDEKK